MCMMKEKEKCVCLCFPRGGLVEGSGEGTNESRGFRDNLWEVKSEVAICSDHRACCALLIPLQLSRSAHTLSIYRDKTPPEPSRALRPTSTPNMAHSAAPKLSSISSPQRCFLSVPLFSAHGGGYVQSLHQLE